MFYLLYITRGIKLIEKINNLYYIYKTDPFWTTDELSISRDRGNVVYIIIIYHYSLDCLIITKIVDKSFVLL